MSWWRRHIRDFVVRHAGGTAVVLVYHRVAELERDPQLLAVRPVSFERHMAMLADRFDVIPLGRLFEGLERRRVPNGAVAVTFDDGYADNLTHAAPILASHGVPATVFVSSGHVDSGSEFWWDELERLVLAPGALPEEVVLDVAGHPFSAVLEGSATYSDEEAARDRSWSVLDAEAGPRQRLYLRLSEYLRPLHPAVRTSALARLRALAGRETEAAARPTHRPLHAAEVSELDASPFVDVAAHTRDHPVLSALDVDEQRRQIVEDRDRLSGLCGRPIASFSYPYGSLDDYTDETVAAVRDAGFAGACSNHLGIVKPWTDPYRVPRCVVRDCEAGELADRIEGWLGGSL